MVAMKENTEMAKFLIQNGADVNFMDVSFKI